MNQWNQQLSQDSGSARVFYVFKHTVSNYVDQPGATLWGSSDSPIYTGLGLQVHATKHGETLNLSSWVSPRISGISQTTHIGP